MESLTKGLTWLILIGGSIMVACKFFPDVSMLFGRIYGYDPNAFPWQGRIYGVVRSPNEAGMYFGLATIILLGAHVRAFKLALFAACLAIVSVLLSQSFTTLLTWGLIILAAVIVRMKGIVRWLIIGAFGLGSAACLLIFRDHNSLIYGKFVNFIYRFGPWKVYWEAAISRWDLFLFGFGWPSYHADNFYVFLFNRGGLALLLATLVWAGWILATHWKYWRDHERMIIFFLIFSGLTIDTLILRPVAALFVCAALPVVARARVKDAV
jgi:O-antigen ligase